MCMYSPFYSENQLSVQNVMAKKRKFSLLTQVDI